MYYSLIGKRILLFIIFSILINGFLLAQDTNQILQDDCISDAALKCRERSSQCLFNSFFAVKTNLLFDAVTAFNGEIEAPLNDKTSVALEWIFPFWKREKSDFTFQLLYAGADFKYWLSNKPNKEPLNGWFCDLYCGFGRYDLQPFRKCGAQGQLFNIGAGAGFAHSIAKNLRLEYSFGLGYIRTNYHKYKFQYDKKPGGMKVVKESGVRSIRNIGGPTKLKISLVRIINYRMLKRNRYDT